jgi:tetratricopeptide (TPR) repeat protein
MESWDEAVASYRKVIASEPNSALAHNNLAWILATCPDPKTRNPAQAVALATKSVGLAPAGMNQEPDLKDRNWNTLGVALYRAREWEASVAAVEKSMSIRRGGDSFDWFFLAMAHWQLGDQQQARKWYDQAVAWMEKNQPENEELRRFRAEAAELIGLPNVLPTKERDLVPAKK